MNEIKMAENKHPNYRKWLILAFCLFLLGGVGYSYYKHHFPYGQSHNCSKIFWMYLDAYAEDHDGEYPSAGGSAESLVLLVEYDLPIEFLAGKSVKPSKTAQYYEKHGTLSEELCGWHYLEGLEKTDSDQIAIMWAKVPLGHNGERLKNPAYEVIFIDGSVQNIKVTQWDEFLAGQAKLRAKR